MGTHVPIHCVDTLTHCMDTLPTDVCQWRVSIMCQCLLYGHSIDTHLLTHCVDTLTHCIHTHTGNRCVSMESVNTVSVSTLWALYRHTSTGWRRLIGSPKLQIIFHTRATKYRSLLWKTTCKDKGSYESSPPCTHTVCE